MASKRKLKSKVYKLERKLRKSKIEHRLARSDYAIELERLAHDLHFADVQIRLLQGDNRIMQDQINAMVANSEKENPTIAPADLLSVVSQSEQAGAISQPQVAQSL